MADVLVDIVWVIGAILLGITAWAIFTGRHHRYYDNHGKRRDWVPPELHPSRKHDRRKSK
jgi:hypothetical protein